MKKHKNKLITAIIIVILLTVAFFHGQAPKQDIASKTSAADTVKDKTEKVVTHKATEKEAAKPVAEDNEAITQKKVNTENTPSAGTDTPDKSAEAEIKKTEEKKENKADFTSLRQMYDNVNPENAEAIPITDKEHTCTLSVRCDTILSNMEDYGEKSIKAVPPDGIIYPEKEVVFYEGESVFNLLLREMKLNGIHFEFVNTPLYKTAYIEGISNIYEFDFGELSGWMYKVNGVFLRYGCSSYILKEGDRIEWVYTCDLGKDVGDFSFEGI